MELHAEDVLVFQNSGVRQRVVARGRGRRNHRRVVTMCEVEERLRANLRQKSRRAALCPRTLWCRTLWGCTSWGCALWGRQSWRRADVFVGFSSPQLNRIPAHVRDPEFAGKPAHLTFEQTEATLLRSLVASREQRLHTQTDAEE